MSTPQQPTQIILHLYIDSPYATHIAFLAFLLNFQNSYTFRIISPQQNKTIIDPQVIDDYKCIYNRMFDRLYNRTGAYHEFGLYKGFLESYFPFYDEPPDEDTTATIISLQVTLPPPPPPLPFPLQPPFYPERQIRLMETSFYKCMYEANVIPVKIHRYERDFNEYRRSIRWIAESAWKRTVTDEELASISLDNKLGLTCVGCGHTDFTDAFAFLLIARFSKEGIANEMHIPLVPSLKAVKYTIPRKSITIPCFAIILPYFTRRFKIHYHSHIQFVINPYCDIFIHIWKEQGPRYEFFRVPVDIPELISLYNPSKILIEHFEDLQPTLTLKGKYTPIFLVHAMQQGDDASRYENGKFYSIWKAFTLMEAFEQEKNFTYDGVMKLHFNVTFDKMDFKAISHDITIGPNRSALYSIFFPSNYHDTIMYQRHPKVGGGCHRCNMEVSSISKSSYFPPHKPRHKVHVNDFDVLWYYGNRENMKKACELYLHAEELYASYLPQGILQYPKTVHNKYRDFVYIIAPLTYRAGVNAMGTEYILCFHDEQLLRTYLADKLCIGTRSILSSYDRFDVLIQRL